MFSCKWVKAIDADKPQESLNILEIVHNKKRIAKNGYWQQDEIYHLKCNLVIEPSVKWALDYIFFAILGKTEFTFLAF